MKKERASKLRNSRNQKDGKPETPSKYLSRRQAAMILGVVPTTLDKLAKIHGLTIRQVPGHDRKHFLHAEIDTLAAKSVVVTEARA